MIRFFISTILCLISFNSNYPQWTNQNPAPDGNDLWSTFFIDDTGWIVGEFGFIKKTTNAGLDWIKQTSGTSLTLRSVQFIDQNTGWICGDEGLIIKTTNGGQNWLELTSGISEKLVDIHFYDLNIGWVVGDCETILKTTNSGTSWTIQSSGTSFNLNSVDFVDAFTGYALGDTTLLKTTDGGLNWIEKSPIFTICTNLNSVEFIDTNTGFIGGAEAGAFRRIYKTTDGGESWTSCVLQNIEGDENSDLMKIKGDEFWGITSIFFKDSDNGYAVGGGRYKNIFTTTNGGSTWESKCDEGIYSGGLFSVTGKGWAIGSSGQIFITEDDGNSWVHILSGSGYAYDDINSVFFINENIGWATGRRHLDYNWDFILKTTNGGKLWKTQYCVGSGWINQLHCVSFIDINNGWVIGDSKILRTTNGGADWVEQTSGTTNSLNAITFTDVNNGTAVGSSGTILRTTNGGSNWTQQTSGTTNELYGVSFTDVNNGISVGSNGTILLTTNGGTTWNSVTSGTTNTLNGIKFFNSNLGMCVGDMGTVLFSSDAGENWVAKSSGISNDLKAVTFTNSTSVWIAGSNGKILSTTDLGNNWISYDLVTTNDLTSLFFINESMGWIGGLNGTILKYQIDVTPVELVSFTAYVQNNSVVLNWQTATELNNSGYQIECKANNANWIILGFVPGYGNSISPNSYSYIDNSSFGGNQYYYRLKQIDIDGSYKFSDVIEVEIVPTQFELSQNYPNPFNPSTTIRFSLPQTTQIKINLFNILGEQVATLADGIYESGYHKVTFNAINLPSGTYVYRFESSEFAQVKKMILIK
jgi:photosystem II stability/assembly factor-like uncharacterized protein